MTWQKDSMCRGRGCEIADNWHRPSVIGTEGHQFNYLYVAVPSSRASSSPTQHGPDRNDTDPGTHPGQGQHWTTEDKGQRRQGGDDDRRPSWFPPLMQELYPWAPSISQTLHRISQEKTGKTPILKEVTTQLGKTDPWAHNQTNEWKNCSENNPGWHASPNLVEVLGNHFYLGVRPEEGDSIWAEAKMMTSCHSRKSWKRDMTTKGATRGKDL